MHLGARAGYPFKAETRLFTDVNCKRRFNRCLSAAIFSLALAALPVLALDQQDESDGLVLAKADTLAGKEVKAGQLVAVGPLTVSLVDDNGDELGKLLPGTPLKVLANANDRVRVELKGWSRADYEVLVMRDLRERLAFARLTEQGQSAHKVLGEKTDPYGVLWQQVRLTGWTGKAGLAFSAAPVWTLGAKLYQNTCNACHVAPAPNTYSANQWPGLISNMVENAGLMGDELVLVRQYLQTHARAPWATGDVSKDE